MVEVIGDKGCATEVDNEHRILIKKYIQNVTLSK